MGFKSSGNLKERPDQTPNDSHNDVGGLSTGELAPLDKIEAGLNSPEPSIDDRFAQLEQEVGNNPQTNLDANGAASDAQNMADGNYAKSRRDTKTALKDGHQAIKEGEDALKSAGKTTGLKLNRPLKAKDQQDPNKFGGTPFGKYRGAGGALGTAASLGGSFAGFMQRHPKKAFAGIAASISIMLLVAALPLLITLEIFQIANNLLKSRMEPGEHIEQTAHRAVLMQVMSGSTKNGGAKIATGRPVSDKIASIRLSRFSNHLAKQGIAMKFDETGRLVGFEKNGTLYKDFKNASFWERRAGVGQLVNEQIAGWRVLKRVKYTRVMRAHARVSFRFFPVEKTKDIRKIMTQRITQGSAAQEVRQPAPKDKDSPASQDTDDASKAVKVVQDEYTKSGNKLEALRKGAAELKGSKAFGITAVATLACVLQEMANQAAEQGSIDRTERLMRYGNTFITLKDQLQTGENVTSHLFGETMKLLKGNPNAPKDSPDRLSFDHSAAWKRTMGQPVNSSPTIGTGKDKKVNPHYNPDLEKGANPDGFALKQVMGVINTIVDGIPGANFACKVLTSWVGWVIMGAEIAVAVASDGASAAVSAGVQVAISVVLFTQVVPEVLAAAADISITGGENAVGMVNNGDAGLMLSANDYQRNYGGRQLTNAEQATVVAAVEDENRQIAQEKGFLWRIASLDNPQSAASRLIVSAPTSPAEALNSTLATISHMPQTFAAAFGATFFGHRLATAANASNINPYNLQIYGLTKADLKKYPDPIANENFLTQEVKDQDGNPTTRLKMLGDPSDYTPDNGDDTNTGNLLHCFVNKFTLEPSPICRGIGKVSNRDGTKTDNPTDQDIVDKIYCPDKNKPCNIQANDDFLRYSMELLYNHVISGIHCASTTEDCFVGTNVGGVSDGSDKCTIVLDPGHSGSDIKTTISSGPFKGLIDHDYPTNPEITNVFNIAKDVESQLTTAGYNVKSTKDLTGSPNQSVSLAERAKIADDTNANMAIAIHTDTQSWSGWGGQVYVQRPDLHRDTASGKQITYRSTHSNWSDVTAASLKYGNDMAATRTSAEGHRVTVTDANFNSRGSTISRGNIPMVQLFSGVPWVYNEIGVKGAPANWEARYAKGIVEGVKKAMPASSCQGNDSNPVIDTTSTFEEAPIASTNKPNFIQSFFAGILQFNILNSHFWGSTP